MEILSLGVLTYLANAIWEVALVSVAAALADRVHRLAPSRYRHAFWVIALTVATFLPLASVKFRRRTGGTVFVSGPASNVAVVTPGSHVPIRQADLQPQAASGNAPLPSAPEPSYRTAWPLAVNRYLAYALLALYAGFLVYRFVKLARAWRMTIQLRAGAFRRNLAGPIAAIVAQGRSALGLGPSADSLTASPEFLFSSAVSLPVTLGALRPAILLPENLIETMDSRELAAALSHELAHVRRRDYLVNLLSELSLVSISFHPAAVFLKRRIDQTREMATDELAASCAQSPASYANALVSLARRVVAPPLPAAQPLGYTSGVLETNNLEERIMTLMEKSSAVSKRTVWLSIASGFILLAPTGLAASKFSLAPSLQQAAPQTAQQENTGSVSGVVTDMSGARLANVTVTLSSPDRSFERKTTTNAAGEYAFENVPPGSYLLEVAKPGPQGRAVYIRHFAVGPPPGQQAKFKGNPLANFPSQPFIALVLNLRPIPVAGPALATAKAPPSAPLPPPKAAPNRIRLGEAVQASKLIAHPQPKYPPLAKDVGIEGAVRLEAVIGKDGTVQDLKALSGRPLLVNAAIGAVRQWRYHPTLLNGMPVEVETTITVVFKPER